MKARQALLILGMVNISNSKSFESAKSLLRYNHKKCVEKVKGELENNSDIDENDLEKLEKLYDDIQEAYTIIYRYIRKLYSKDKYLKNPTENDLLEIYNEDNIKLRERLTNKELGTDREKVTPEEFNRVFEKNRPETIYDKSNADQEVKLILPSNPHQDRSWLQKDEVSGKYTQKFDEYINWVVESNPNQQKLQQQQDHDDDDDDDDNGIKTNEIFSGNLEEMHSLRNNRIDDYTNSKFTDFAHAFSKYNLIQVFKNDKKSKKVPPVVAVGKRCVPKFSQIVNDEIVLGRKQKLRD